MNYGTIYLVLCTAFAMIRAQLPPYLNCTRYLEPCIVKRGESCCGYPFYDCISDGREALCQSVSDFPELSAELMLRLREAKDRGDPEASEIQKDVYDLLGTTRRPGGGRRNPPRSGGNRRQTTRRPGRQNNRATRRRTTPRRTTPRSNSD